MKRAAAPPAHSVIMGTFYEQRLRDTCCALLVAGVLLLMTSDVAHAEPTQLQVYGRQGYDVLLPGVETELQGDGVLEWHVKKPGDQESQWILTYHYGSDEPQTLKKYQHRILFSLTNASLRLLNLSPQDEGLYILQLMFMDKNHVQLKVIEPISEIKIMKILSSGDSGVRLMCEASGDVWNLAWRNNGRELMQNITHGGNTSELVIKEVGTGSYICVAWNPISELETSYQIAEESAVILYVVGFLTAAVIFGLPVFISEFFLFICRKRFCQRLEQRVDEFQLIPLVCWFFFLICALVSAILTQCFSVSYACPACNLAFLVALVNSLAMESLWLMQTKSQSLDNRKMGMSQLIGQCMKGTLNFLRLALRFLLLLDSFSMLLLYFCTDAHAYGKQSHFDWTFLFAVLVPVPIVILIYRCCRPNGPLSCLHRTQRGASEMHRGLLTPCYTLVLSPYPFTSPRLQPFSDSAQGICDGGPAPTAPLTSNSSLSSLQQPISGAGLTPWQTVDSRDEGDSCYFNWAELENDHAPRSAEDTDTKEDETGSSVCSSPGGVKAVRGRERRIEDGNEPEDGETEEESPADPEPGGQRQGASPSRTSREVWLTQVRDRIVGWAGRRGLKPP
ncbi:uncharacterized protein LOC144821687 [Lissotriton helveticus]